MSAAGGAGRHGLASDTFSGLAGAPKVAFL